ncbi:MAG: hypothetical protein ABSF28_01980 [Terracidiphilus sp.]
MTTVLANPTTPSSTGCARIAGKARADAPAGPARRCFDAPVPLALWHLSSLDAPTVAVVWALAFAWAARVPLPAWTPVLLALVAWPVYIADRLLDVRAAFRTAQAHPLRLRHYFHWRHRRFFIPLAAVSACVAAWIILDYMPVAARERNSILVAAGLAYFSSVHAGRSLSRFLSGLLAPLLTKETLVAVIFTAACALPTLGRGAASAPAHSASPMWSLGFTMVYFTLLAWLNCHSIERWEFGEDDSRGDHSRRRGTFSRAIGLGLAGLLLAAALSPNHRIALLVASGAAAALLLALLDRLRGNLTPLALRAAADLVLLTPVPFLFR